MVEKPQRKQYFTSAHRFCNNRIRWYRKYHAWRHALKINWLLFIVFMVGVATGVTLDSRGYVRQEVFAVTEDATSTVTSNADWNAGTTTNLDVASGSISLTDNSWTKRDSFVVSAGDATDLSEYQVEVSVDTASLILAGDLQADCDDLRFYQVESDGSETALTYYLEYNECDDAATTIWLKMEDIPGSGSTTVQMYYGNNAASEGSDLAATFSYDTPRTVGYIIGDDPSALDHVVMSLIDNNIVSDGTTTLTLGANETGTFPAADLNGATAITANGLISVQTDAASGDMHDAFVPVSFAGTRIMFHNGKTNDYPQVGIVSPWGTAAVEVYHKGVKEYDDNVTSSGVTVDSTQTDDYTAVRVESTNSVPVLATYWESDGGENFSQVGVPVTASALYGVRSNNVELLIGTANTTWTWISHIGTTDTGTEVAADTNKHISGTVGGQHGAGHAFKVTADQPMGIAQRSDGDNNEAVPFLPLKEAGTLFGSANRMQYAAFAAPYTGTTCILADSSGTTIETGVSSGAGVFKIHVGDDTNVFHDIAGTAWTISCDKPVIGYVEIDDALPGGVDDETSLFSYKQMRQYYYPVPSVGALAGEEAVTLEPYGAYVSPTGASAIDLTWNGGWGDGTAGSTALTANVTIPANSSIRFGMKSAASTATLASASYTTVGTASSTGAYTLTANNLSAIGTGTNRYIQLRAELLSDNASADPVLDDITLSYQADNEAPANPAGITAEVSPTDNTLLTDEGWYNYATPYFSWTGASDNDSGVDSYYVYFGSDGTATPSTDGAQQSGTTYTGGLTSIDHGDTIYLRIQTRDVAENNFISALGNYTQYTYKYDIVEPTNPEFITVTPAGYASTNNFTFVWPTGSDDDSGIQGYYYKTGESGASETLVTDTSISGIEAYQDGTNTFLVQTIDSAGNRATNWIEVSYFFSLDDPSPPQNLSVSPETSTTNAFTFSWDEPDSYVAPIALYRYSINALPTSLNTTSTTSATVGPIPAATQQGVNTFYVVAEDEAGNISYSQYSSINFSATTTAPGIPTNFALTDSSDRDAERYSNTLSWDVPADVGSGIDHYVIYRGDSSADVTLADSELELVQIAETASTAYIDASLDNTKRYYYQIKSSDNAGALSAGSSILNEIPEGRYTSPPAITELPSVTPGPYTAVVSWETERGASSFVDFGKVSVDENEQGTAALVEEHEVTVEGLEEKTTYFYRTKSIDRDNNSALSSIATFTTTEAPYVTSVAVNDIRLFTAVVTWKTNVPTTSIVNYGPSSSLGLTTEDTTNTLVSDHSIILSNLDHSTLYHVRLAGQDASGNAVRSDNYSFKTLTFPRIIEDTIQFINVAEGQTEVRWQTNVPTTSTVEYILDDVGRTQGSEALVADHSILLFGLEDDTIYQTRLRGNDQFGNEAISSLLTFTTLKDTTPPIISAVRSESNTRGYGDESRVQLIVAWRTNEPTAAMIEYGAGQLSDIYPEESDLNEELVYDHILIVSDLSPARRYSFRIVSTDKAGNVAYSEALSILTATQRKTFLQLVIENLEDTFSWVGRFADQFR